MNNLKNIDLQIPRDKFVVITGLSGSGKSSVAFDTVYAEGNRRYMESLSSYAQNFLEPSAKPEVDQIENLSPSISIDQKSISRSPRSTVGTLTEIYDYLRILFAKVGTMYCPECGQVMRRKTNRQILSDILSLEHHASVVILAPLKSQHGDLKENLRNISQLGYARIRSGNKIITINEAQADPDLLSQSSDGSQMEIVVDRLILDRKEPDEERILDSIETAMKLSGGSMTVLVDNKTEQKYNRDFFCANCKIKIKEISPRHFSFNNPEGACSVCSGLGYVPTVNPELVIANRNLSILEGAILPWSKSGGRISNQNGNWDNLKSAARKYKFSLTAPLKKFSAKQMEILLHGNEEFEGVIGGLLQKYQQTKSDYVRAEIEKYMTSDICGECQGRKLKKEFLAVRVENKSIDDLVRMSINDLRNFFQNFNSWSLKENEKNIAKPLVEEAAKRLEALENVGLDYLNLGRSAQTISGGEAQRIRLATQLNSQLMGIVYVLDEPSVGLHSRDTEKLISTLKRLQDLGNSLVVVEHDESIIKAADWIIDMGPGAGEEGGTVVFDGPYEKLLKSKSLTAQYILDRKKISSKKKIQKGNGKEIKIIGASENNLKNIDIKIPLGKFVVMCGVSGSGKSTLVRDIISKALARHFYKAKDLPGNHRKIVGLSNIDKVISINQSPIGRTPRSNAATYTGLFTHIRELFAQTEEAKNRGYSASRFSFNMKGGRCEVCQGDGLKKIEMHLLPDMYVRCESCGGTRYNRKTLEIEYKGFNIAEVLDMDVRFASRFFAKHPLIVEKLKTMEDVGLGYLKLGQNATSLSGGEAQRIKLATELARKSTGRTLYILDEPTVGLHFEDIRQLLQVLNALVEKGNSVLVVEHNLDVIRSADWVIELGPDGGSRGGEIIFEGLPDNLKKNQKSWTARYL